MATRSTINRKLESGKIETVYCHWDGYLSNNGVLLFENYQTEEIINELFEKARMGGISSLGPIPDNCRFYNDHEEETTLVGSEKELVTEFGQEYNYLWKDGQWFVNYGQGSGFDLLFNELGKEGLVK